MYQRGAPERAVLNRRMVAWSLVVGLAALLRAPARRAMAHSSTPAPAAAPDLARLFPAEHELPAGLELESTGARDDIAQLAGTFRNSRDAAQLLAGWGWVGNAYRSYAARAGANRAAPARLEISLHQFSSITGAAYALSYFAHDRAVALHHQEVPGDSLLPCAATVTGEGSATRFLRYGSLLVRVTVVMPSSVDAAVDPRPLAMATDLALAVLAKAGQRGSPGRAGC